MHALTRITWPCGRGCRSTPFFHLSPSTALTPVPCTSIAAVSQYFCSLGRHNPSWFNPFHLLVKVHARMFAAVVYMHMHYQWFLSVRWRPEIELLHAEWLSASCSAPG